MRSVAFEIRDPFCPGHVAVACRSERDVAGQCALPSARAQPAQVVMV
jgi:hypothetical protein